ncbi:MAG TPA: FmdB family zinc ribbon protein [Candidatus Limnocylindria bacterium]
MPTYDYQCRSCGHTVEVIHSMTEEGPSTCERCGGELRRVLYPTGIIFKGSGFYKTDSRASGGSNGAKEKAPDKSTTDKPAPTPSDSGTSSSGAESSSSPPATAKKEPAGS